MKTHSTRNLSAVCAGFFAFAASFGAEQTLPTPPPSGFADTESSVVAALPDRRKFSVSIDWLPTPSNCVQVAFGQDRNSDEDLEPEETDLVRLWRSPLTNSWQKKYQYKTIVRAL